MLVTFTCKKYETIMMFGDVALRLLTLMGHSGTVPGAILAADIPDALSRLKKGVEKAKPEDNARQKDDDEAISLANRALPLIRMLEAANKNNCNIMWK